MKRVIKWFVIAVFFDLVMTLYGTGRDGIESEMNHIALYFLHQGTAMFIIFSALYCIGMIILAQRINYPYGSYLLYVAIINHLFFGASWFNFWYNGIIYQTVINITGVSPFFVVITLSIILIKLFPNIFKPERIT